MPVPETDCVVGELVALLTKVIVPEAAPLDCGEKVTVNCVLWPALIVTGNEIPLRTNSALLEEPEVTVTLDPLAFRVPVRFELSPTVTLPKLREVGETLSVAGLVPVPDSGIDKLGLGAFDVIARDPQAEPLVVGAKVTVKLTLCPAVSVCGTVSPVELKPVPEIVA